MPNSCGTIPSFVRAMEPASIEAGCDGHLTKPVERDDLVAAIVKFAKHAARPIAVHPDRIAAHRPAFLEYRRLDLSKMKAALLAGDFATIQHIGHNCKGIGTGYGSGCSTPESMWCCWIWDCLSETATRVSARFKE